MQHQVMEGRVVMVDRAIIIGRTKLESAFALHFYVFPEYAAVKPLAMI